MIDSYSYINILIFALINLSPWSVWIYYHLQFFFGHIYCTVPEEVQNGTWDFEDWAMKKLGYYPEGYEQWRGI